MRSQSSHTHIQLTPTQAHVQISGPTVKPHKHHSNCCHCYQVDLLGFKLQSIAESKQIFTLKSSCSLPFVPTLCNGSISVESESRDFHPDPDHSVNSGLLFTSFSLSRTHLMTLLPFPFIPSYLLQSLLNQTFLYHSTLNCDDVDS